VDSPVVGAVLAQAWTHRKTKATAAIRRRHRMRESMECGAQRRARQVNHVVRLMNHNPRSDLAGKPTMLVTSLKVCLSEINLIS
jgi:hypothetical protein